MMHDRYISTDPNKQPSRREAYHWSHALSAFNQQLSQVPQGEEQTALLTTASVLGLLTFSQIEAETPEDAWPLAPPSPSDLTWLKMSDGKKEVFKLTQKSEAESSPLFKKLSYIYTDQLLPISTALKKSAVEGDFPPEIYSIYDLNPTSVTDDDNPPSPLKWAAGRLAQVLSPTTPPTCVVFGFLYMISVMRPDFKYLLEQKEPRALLLMAWWFAKVSRLGLWWLERRSRLEGLSICLYLEKAFPEDVEMMRMLEYPRSIFKAAVPGGACSPSIGTS
jgi:hypothetical protein